MKKRLILILLFCIIANQLFALNYGKVIKNNKANRKYNEEKFEEAKKLHKENSIKYPDNTNIHFNLGDAYYKDKEYDKAITEYKNSMTDDKIDKSNVYYNIGNAYFQKQAYDKALESYKSSLLSNPNNINAKYNYELTKRFLQKQQQQQKQDNQDKKQKSDKSKKEQSQKQKQKPEQKENQEQEQQSQQQKKEDKKQQEQQQRASEEKLKQAERILDAMQRVEKENQKKKVKQLLKKIKIKPVEKNW